MCNQERFQGKGKMMKSKRSEKMSKGSVRQEKYFLLENKYVLSILKAVTGENNYI